MALITKDQLIQIVGTRNADKVDLYYDHLVKCLKKYDITTPLRIAHFVAQLAHESGGFRWAVEIWPAPMLDSDGVAHNGSSYQMSYEGREELGNTKPGDGYRFRGRGLIQLTGRANYTKYGSEIGVNLAANPDLVSTPRFAVDAAGWFWNRRNLNQYADRDDILTITKKINGGTLGLESRKELLAKAKKAISSPQASGGAFGIVEVLGMGFGFYGGYKLIKRFLS